MNKRGRPDAEEHGVTLRWYVSASCHKMSDTDTENSDRPEQADQVKSLYEVLGVERTASQEVIKKTYYRLCLKLHPDKNPGDEGAKAKFQALQRVYAVLGDPEKRSAYDQTGITDDDLLGANSSTELYQYFRAMFKEVTEDDLDNFYDQYRGSDEERADLLKHYKGFKGDMAQVFEWLMCSEPDKDSHRFMDTIQSAIETGEVKAYKAFKGWAEQVAARPRPADPLKIRSKEKGGMSQALMAIRQKRAASSMAFFDHLEQKYAKAGSGSRKAKVAEPSEEEFEAARQRAFGGKGKQDAPGQGKQGAKAKGAGKKKGKVEVEPVSEEDESERYNEKDEECEEESEVSDQEQQLQDRSRRGKENRTGTGNGRAVKKGGKGGTAKKTETAGKQATAGARKKAKA